MRSFAEFVDFRKSFKTKESVQDVSKKALAEYLFHLVLILLFRNTQEQELVSYVVSKEKPQPLKKNHLPFLHHRSYLTSRHKQQNLCSLPKIQNVQPSTITDHWPTTPQDAE
jgi:hypothetical protein